MKTVKNVTILAVFFFSLKIQAQTFFTEDFNSYPVGHLNAVYDDTTPGQGGWLVARHHSNLTTGMITAEAGKGNVLTITTTGTTLSEGFSFRQEDGFLTTLWNNRTPGTNILQFEYEFYSVGTFSFGGNLISDGHGGLINTSFQPNLRRILGSYTDNLNIKTLTLQSYSATTFPHNLWIKVEMFVDYNTNNLYFYLPTLNIQATAPFNHNYGPNRIDSHVASFSAPAMIKIDNIKVTGLKTLPSYILSTSEHLATKFNIYPNPATNVVNITNTENMHVQQVTIYDITGKQLTAQSYNSETQIQLNIEHLASGTYLLYLQSNEGTAVKKFIKK